MSTVDGQGSKRSPTISLAGLIAPSARPTLPVTSLGHHEVPRRPTAIAEKPIGKADLKHSDW